MRIGYKVFVVILLLILSPSIALAQDETPAIELRLSRDNGYGLGNQMQGNFSYRVSGPDDLVRVEYLMDGEVIGESKEAPFRLRFITDNFELGRHEMSAVGYTANGQRLVSNTFVGEFVSPQITNRFTFGVIGFVIVVIVARFLFFKQGSGKTKKGYGAFGGAVCKYCGRPFSRHFWGLNLLTNKYDRCPHCGKWQGTRMATPEELAAAETFEKALDSEGVILQSDSPGEQEKLKKQLEESRFEDM